MNSAISESNVSTLSQAEIEEASRYLDETRDRLIEAVKSTNDSQWKFKPASGCWSIAENVEHIAIVENSFLKNVAARFHEAPAPQPGRDLAQEDRRARAEGVDRYKKFSAPERILPSGTWSREEAIERFAEARSHTVAFLRSSELNHRAHVISHPIIGALDAYQWVLLVSAHTERHLNQLLEVKADPEFPAQ
jgi:uncharacterized damage-inducible protein DinB